MWGLAPYGYHATSLLLHLANVGLLFAFARRAAADRDEPGGARPRGGREFAVAFTAAVLLAVHPLMTQAVGYVAARADLLCATLLLAALLCYRAYVMSGHRRWLVATLAAWLLALAAKETVAMLPPLLALYDWLVLRARRDGLRRRLLGIHLPLMGIMFAVALIRMGVLLHMDRRSVGLASLDPRARRGRRAAAGLSRCWVVPIGQSVFHPVAAIRSLTDPRGLFALAWLRRSASSAMTRRHARDWLAALGVAWLACCSIPPAVLVMLRPGRADDGRAPRMLPAWGCSCLQAPSRAGSGGRGRVTWRGASGSSPTALAGIVAVLGLLTIERNAVWTRSVRP